jgi:hypothetical protein
MKEKIKMLFVKKETLKNSDGTYAAGTCTIIVVNIEPTLKNYYKKLDCECIDIQERKFGGVPFDIVCDDEACCYPVPPVKSVKSKTDSRFDICNTVLIGKSQNGEMRSMTDAEIKHIKRFFNPLPWFNAMLCD